MWKHEAQRGHAFVQQFWHQRLEVVAVGAEAVHPDDRESGIGSGFDGDGFQRFQTIVSEMVVAVRFAAHISESTSSRTPGKNV